MLDRVDEQGGHEVRGRYVLVAVFGSFRREGRQEVVPARCVCLKVGRKRLRAISKSPGTFSCDNWRDGSAGPLLRLIECLNMDMGVTERRGCECTVWSGRSGLAHGTIGGP